MEHLVSLDTQDSPATQESVAGLAHQVSPELLVSPVHPVPVVTQVFLENQVSLASRASVDTQVLAVGVEHRVFLATLDTREIQASVDGLAHQVSLELLAGPVLLVSLAGLVHLVPAEHQDIQVHRVYQSHSKELCMITHSYRTAQQQVIFML